VTPKNRPFFRFLWVFEGFLRVFVFFLKSPFVSNLTSGARKKAGGFWVAVRINKAQSPSELAFWVVTGKTKKRKKSFGRTRVS
jgi:hypothetical protein